MKEYATEDDTCRSRFLLKYFGQEESKDCGTCDICRRKASDGRKTATEQALMAYIGQKDGKYRLEDINMVFGAPGAGYAEDYLSILRELIDSGAVPPYGL